MTTNKLDRRNFLKASALVGGGLMLEFNFVSMVSAEELGTLVGSKELNVFVKIASDGKITIYSATPEMVPVAASKMMPWGSEPELMR